MKGHTTKIDRFNVNIVIKPSLNFHHYKSTREFMINKNRTNVIIQDAIRLLVKFQI